MIWHPFKVISKSFLGIDIGTSTIRIVEISAFGEKRKLENYGEIKAASLSVDSFRNFEEKSLLLSNESIAKGILTILKEAQIKEKKCCLSIPDFSTFYTNFDLPPMTEKEIEEAVKYEARRHIPLPLSEVILDWQVIEGKVSEKKPVSCKILLVAVPKEVIDQYQQIANLANLELLALEAEVFGLMRALIKKEEKVIALLDIGARSSTCSLVDKGVLQLSHSFDTSGNDLTALLAKSLNINYQEAENLKKEYGLLKNKENIFKILSPLVDLIISEVKRICQSFSQTTGKKTEKIILAGGSALLPGLKEYFSQRIKAEIEIANPFSEIIYPQILEKEIKKMGPSYAIAVGEALRGLE
jgi:type IV pilus assembly protein PilM